MDFNQITRPLVQIASAVGATELALFSVQRHHRLGHGLKKLVHVRPDESNAATRQAAISAFQELIAPCVEKGRDGAIAVSFTTSPDQLQFCLIKLLRQENAVIGVVAFILRRQNVDCAKATLELIGRDIGRLGL